MADKIFDAIEQLEARTPAPWGAVLDAGTGRHSLTWLAGIARCARWTAVTAAEGMRQEVAGALAGRVRAQDRIVIGNWRDPAFLAGERFDVVLADYLLGALDAFDPFGQEELFPRLRPHVAGRLYVVGLEPSPPRAEGAWGQLVLEIERLRDACVLLAGDRCYREYPRRWVVASLERAGFRVSEQRAFPIRYGDKFVNGQLGVAESKLERIRARDAALGRELAAAIERLRRRAQDAPRATFGEDYLVAAEPR
ncbi:MAG: class I SAM-dependent methyltransferase [Planctomycetota bacterium]